MFGRLHANKTNRKFLAQQYRSPWFPNRKFRLFNYWAQPSLKDCQNCGLYPYEETFENEGSLNVLAVWSVFSTRFYAVITQSLDRAFLEGILFSPSLLSPKGASTKEWYCQLSTISLILLRMDQQYSEDVSHGNSFSRKGFFRFGYLRGRKGRRKKDFFCFSWKIFVKRAVISKKSGNVMLPCCECLQVVGKIENINRSVSNG